MLVLENKSNFENKTHRTPDAMLAAQLLIETAMPIILKASPTNKRADLKAFVIGRLASIQAELELSGNPAVVPNLVKAGILLPGEGLGDLNYLQAFPSVDWEESVEDNMADIEADSWWLTHVAKEGQ